MQKSDKNNLKTAYVEDDDKKKNLAKRTSAFWRPAMPAAANDSQTQAGQSSRADVSPADKVSTEPSAFETGQESENPPEQQTTPEASGPAPLTDEQRAARRKKKIDELNAKIAATEARRLEKGSARGGGPKSEEGKAASSKNSTKHGAYSVAFSETDAFFDLENAMTQKLVPTTAIERYYASSIAHSMFGATKLDEYQRKKLRQAETREPSTMQVASAVGFPFGTQHFEVLKCPPSEEELWSRVRGHIANWLDPERTIWGSKNERLLKFFKFAHEKLAKMPLQHIEEDFFREFDLVMVEVLKPRNYVLELLDDCNDRTPLIDYWLYRNLSAISLAKESIRTKGCLDVLTDEKTSRARAHLNGVTRDLFAAVMWHQVNNPGKQWSGTLQNASDKLSVRE